MPVCLQSAVAYESVEGNTPEPKRRLVQEMRRPEWPETHVD